ncbi:MAG: hypothetical protein R3F37_11960 [Candidatus Competibacteraceae bacterium]
MVGWLIAWFRAAHCCGTLSGYDFTTGISYTLMLMMAGVILGCFAAWKTERKNVIEMT